MATPSMPVSSRLTRTAAKNCKLRLKRDGVILNSRATKEKNFRGQYVNDREEGTNTPSKALEGMHLHFETPLRNVTNDRTPLSARRAQTQFKEQKTPAQQDSQLYTDGAVGCSVMNLSVTFSEHKERHNVDQEKLDDLQEKLSGLKEKNRKMGEEHSDALECLEKKNTALKKELATSKRQHKKTTSSSETKIQRLKAELHKARKETVDLHDQSDKITKLEAAAKKAEETEANLHSLRNKLHKKEISHKEKIQNLREQVDQANARETAERAAKDDAISNLNDLQTKFDEKCRSFNHKMRDRDAEIERLRAQIEQANAKATNIQNLQTTVELLVAELCALKILKPRAEENEAQNAATGEQAVMELATNGSRSDVLALSTDLDDGEDISENHIVPKDLRNNATCMPDDYSSPLPQAVMEQPTEECYSDSCATVTENSLSIYSEHKDDGERNPDNSMVLYDLQYATGGQRSDVLALSTDLGDGKDISENRLVLHGSQYNAACMQDDYLTHHQAVMDQPTTESYIDICATVVEKSSLSLQSERKDDAKIGEHDPENVLVLCDPRYATDGRAVVETSTNESRSDLFALNTDDDSVTTLCKTSDEQLCQFLEVLAKVKEQCNLLSLK